MKRNDQGKTEDGSVNYWRSTADLLMGIMLLLFLLLLIFMYRSIGFEKEHDLTDHPFENESDYNDYNQYRDDGGDGGDGGHGGPGGSADQTDGGGGQDDFDEEFIEDVVGDGIVRAAIKVIAKDIETGSTIQMADLTYQLYTSANKRMTLSTHYPEVITYSTFNTLENGTLFLPEKITEGIYRLNATNAPEGYDVAEPVTFTIDKDYDWREPFVVNMYYGLQKNEVFIKVVDSLTGNGLSGFGYDVISVNEIKNIDGEVEYAEGQVVAHVLSGTDGTGHSDEIYIGDYNLKPTATPDGYSIPQNEYSIHLQKKSTDPVPEEIERDETRVTLTVLDEQTHEPLSGAKFQMTGGNENDIQMTDTDGKAVFSRLKRGGEYLIRQTEAPGTYKMSGEDIPVHVDENGLLDGIAQSEVTLSNRMIRVSLGVHDTIMRTPVIGVSARLIDENGTSVYEWTTTDQNYLLDGVEPGSYTLEVDGKLKASGSVEINDIANIQRAELRIVSDTDLMIMIGAGAAVILLIVVVWLFLKKRKKKK